MLTTNGVKECSTCKHPLPATTRFFGRSKSQRDGLSNQCKFCRRADYLKHQPARLAIQARYRRQKLQKCREAVRSWRADLRSELINGYGGKCECCGESEHTFLTIDHRLGGGNLHVRMLGGNYKLYLELKKQGWPKDLFRLLCWNCNFATRRGNSCPHQRNALVPNEIPYPTDHYIRRGF